MFKAGRQRILQAYTAYLGDKILPITISLRLDRLSRTRLERCLSSSYRPTCIP